LTGRRDHAGSRKSERGTTATNGHGEFDKPIVPAKPAITNFWELLKSWKQVEGRGLAKENGEGIDLLRAGPAKQVHRTQCRVSAGASPALAS